jgi:uncharacterized protein
MIINSEIILSPQEATFTEHYKAFFAKKIGKKTEEISHVELLKKSIDSRGKIAKIIIRADIYINELPPNQAPLFNYKNVSNSKQVLIIGAGPAGLFAALRMLELGLKPIIIERGKDVRSRRRDLAAINKEHIVNPESNYCFGEGGAGTYSDGKLYTRSDKRGNVKRVLELLVFHGAKEEILYEAHPHIGTNKLPTLITKIRETIIEAGGEVHFETKMLNLLVENNEVKGAITDKLGSIRAEAVILATGHSARDIFYLFKQNNWLIEAKPFAMGVRIEHPQELIDKIQYKCDSRGEYLPAAPYALVHQVKHYGLERGVFSFCMCPGGFIVPSATAPSEVVVNGMSPSRRDSRFANSGIVVAINLEDFKPYEKHQELAGLVMQAELEQKACAMAGGTQVAPAQRMVDFVNKKVSSTFKETSYQPGLASVDLHELLPLHISYRLQEGFKAFGDKMKGYLTNEAQLVGVESRTSSPVKIPRDKETLEHLQLKNLYPCGEGAGYAGGIVSAAIDGMRCAEMIAVKLGVF